MRTDWQTKELEDCIDKVVYTTKINQLKYLETGKYPIVSQDSALISGYWNDDKDVFKISKPIVVFGDHTKVLKYIDFNFVLGADGVKILQPKNFLNAKYFYHYLNSIQLRSLGYARHYKILKEKLVPVPEIGEQRRIVEVLDEALENVDDSIKKTQQNIANLKELWNSALNQAFTHNSQHWQETTLPDLSENLDRQRIPITKSNRKNGNIPYYGASGIVDYIESFIFDETLLLISEDGANLIDRRYPIAFTITGKTWVNNHAHVLKFHKEATHKFVEFYINSINIEKHVTGAAQPKLNQTSLNKILIPLPPLSEQKKIVEKLDALSSEIKALKSNYLKKLENLSELKQAILNKAFNGEL